jgi:hypothetical protein
MAAAWAMRPRHSPDVGIQWLLVQARDVLHRAMHPPSYCRICMVIEITREVGVIFIFLHPQVCRRPQPEVMFTGGER